MRPLAELELEQALKNLFPKGRGQLCEQGTILLRTFAQRRPTDVSFLKAADVQNDDSGFAGIPEWDAFTDHYTSCRRTVQTLLGHTSSEVTREHYIHAVSSESRNAVGRIEELAIGPKWTQIESVAKKPKALAS